MTATHGQIARQLVAQSPAGVFARAALDVVAHNDYTTLERMLPGVRFASRKLSPTETELVGTCADGSIVIWRLDE